MQKQNRKQEKENLLKMLIFGQTFALLTKFGLILLVLIGREMFTFNLIG